MRASSAWPLRFWGDRLLAAPDTLPPGITIKQYPRCGSIHPAKNAVIALATTHEVSLEMVAQVECWTRPRPREPRGPDFASAGTVVDKFRKLAGRRVSAAQVERVIDAVLGAERLDDAGEPPRPPAAGGDAGR